jgi:hypothetical protein
VVRNVKLTYGVALGLGAAGLIILWLPMHIQARASRPRLATFTCEGISLSLKGRWVASEQSVANRMHPAKLTSPEGTIQGLLLPPDVTLPQRAAAGLQASFASRPEAIRKSTCREEFVTESGLTGVHISFSRVADTQQETTSHHYLVKNRLGRCVAIDYEPTTQANAGEVDESIRKSLRW